MPRFLRGEGRGWVTAEYGMLPRSTGTRMGREASRGKQGGRTVEIQRLIGRALRADSGLVRGEPALGERRSVDHGDHAVDGHPGADIRPVEGPHQRLRQGKPGRLDNDMIRRLVAVAGAANVSGWVNPVHELARLAHEAGAKFYCCSPNLDLFDMTTDDLIPECAGIVGGAHLIEEVMEEDCKVLTY